MSQTIMIMGRQPALGAAELESIYGADKIKKIGNQAILLEVDVANLDFDRLGGSMKAGKHLTTLPFTDWQKIEDFLDKEIIKYTGAIGKGKIRLGLSAYGFNINFHKLNATGLRLKKIVKKSGRSVRVVPNKASELNTAQILHNQLVGATGFEILLIKGEGVTVVAQTFKVQDIEAYAARDQARPKRDARVGMLPPKLAQIIVNLSSDANTKTILDPFCGTGVVLQEAMLMGYQTYGTDIEPRMIEYSKTNLDWLMDKKDLSLAPLLAVGDATNFQWTDQFSNIACETYLGQPFSAEPCPEKLAQVIQDVDTIHRKFLKNVAKQTVRGFKMCIAVPAWNTKNGFKHLKILDSLEELGYTRVSFAHASDKDLLYYRDDQIVARELVVLIRQ